MFCSKCGKELQDDAIFCFNCGEKLGITKNYESTMQQESNAKAISIKQEKKIKKHRSKKVLILAVSFSIVLIVAVVIFLVLFANNKQPKTVSDFISYAKSKNYGVEDWSSDELPNNKHGYAYIFKTNTGLSTNNNTSKSLPSASFDFTEFKDADEAKSYFDHMSNGVSKNGNILIPVTDQHNYSYFACVDYGPSHSYAHYYKFFRIDNTVLYYNCNDILKGESDDFMAGFGYSE